MLETDPSEILNEIIYATRKGGNIGIGAAGFGAGSCMAPRTCMLPLRAAHADQAAACAVRSWRVRRLLQPLQHRRVHGEGA
jgi:hypothetical protein